MAGECQTYPDDVSAAYDLAEGKLSLLQSNYQSMTTQMHTTQLATWHTKLINCFSCIQSMLEWLIFANIDAIGDKRIPYLLKNCAGGAVDMDAILSAMLGASFDQLQNFIGIEDAYRVALWNAPFNADYYAALARGFIKW